METGITKNRLIAELIRSPHGKLEEYLQTGKQAASQEPGFYAHLLSWNRVNGQVRDAKVALPIVSLLVPAYTGVPEFKENSLAHMATLDPRNLLRGLRFAKSVKVSDRALRRLVRRYLHSRETNRAKWDRTAVQHRRTLKELYALYRVKPSDFAEAILFKGERPEGSVFAVIANLKNMAPEQAAGEIMARKIPFLIAVGALGEKAKDPSLVLALINQMSPTELVNNTKTLERLGMKLVPALRGAYEEALKRAATSKTATLKTTRAVEAVEDETLKAKLLGLQEKQLNALGGIDGNWLVLADKSGSMAQAIEGGRQVAAILARMVKGKVHLVFFDTAPTYCDATGKTYDEIQQITRHVTANGGTSIGCGLRYVMDRNLEVDGIAVISDAQENNAPLFAAEYRLYTENFGKQPAVYLYRFACGSRGWADKDLAESMQHCGYDLQEFDLQGGVDFYSLPNLVSTMSANRYSLIDKILASPLLKLDDVLERIPEVVSA